MNLDELYLHIISLKESLGEKKYMLISLGKDSVDLLGVVGHQ